MKTTKDYKLREFTETQPPYIGKHPMATIRQASDLRPIRLICEWGKLEYVLTPFDIVYTAIGKDGRIISDGTRQWPVANETDSDETVRIVAREIADLVSSSRS